MLSFFSCSQSFLHQEGRQEVPTRLERLDRRFHGHQLACALCPDQDACGADQRYAVGDPGDSASALVVEDGGHSTVTHGERNHLGLAATEFSQEQRIDGRIQRCVERP